MINHYYIRFYWINTNKIVLVGSPIGNMRLENLYKQEILRLIE